MRDVIREIVDDGEVFEVHEHWAANVICALVRLGGQVTGIVANQPAHLAGVLDISASEKAARFVQICDVFNIPLVTLVDVPGFLPARPGTWRHHPTRRQAAVRLLQRHGPPHTTDLAQGIRGRVHRHGLRSIGADLSLAWPTNEIAVMGAEGAANVIFRREISAAADPEAVRTLRIAEYRDELMHPYHAAERGLVDDVIDPAETRFVLIKSLAMLHAKHRPLPSRKHGNQPQ